MSVIPILAIAGAAFLAFIVSWWSVGWVRTHAVRLGLLDLPGERKIHTVPIPVGGGLGIWLGVCVTFSIGTLVCFLLPIDAAWIPQSMSEQLPGLRAKAIEIWALLAGGTVLMVLGLADDKFNLRWTIRLGIEFAVAAFIVYWQGLQLTAFIDSTFITSMLSVIWIVTLINSFNMLDNMDGLSGGVAAISAAMLGGMLLIEPAGVTARPQLFVAAMLFVLVGALLGFLRHNWAPAKIFMGDGGSYFVGYWIAISSLLATYSSYQSDSRHAVLAPLCVLAIPLYDTVSVIWIRLREGRSPFEGDKRHFSHRLVDLGFSKRNAVLTIYLATLTCSMGALLLPRTDTFGAGLIVGMVLCIVGMVAVLEQRTRENHP